MLSNISVSNFSILFSNSLSIPGTHIRHGAGVDIGMTLATDARNGIFIDVKNTRKTNVRDNLENHTKNTNTVMLIKTCVSIDLFTKIQFSSFSSDIILKNECIKYSNLKF